MKLKTSFFFSDSSERKGAPGLNYYETIYA